MSLLAYYPLRISLQDEINYKNTATIVGSVSQDTTNSISGLGSYKWTADGSYLNIGPGNNIFSEEGSSFTLSLWVYLTGINNKQTGLLGFNQSQQYGIGIGLNTSYKPIIMIMGNGTSIQTVSSKAIELNKWTYIVLTYDNKTNIANLYVDGEITATEQLTFTWLTGEGNFYIGGNPQSGWNSSLLGNICEVKLYDECLPESQIYYESKGCIVNFDFNNYDYVNNYSTNIVDSSGYNYIGAFNGNCNFSTDTNCGLYSINTNSTADTGENYFYSILNHTHELKNFTFSFSANISSWPYASGIFSTEISGGNYTNSCIRQFDNNIVLNGYADGSTTITTTDLAINNEFKTDNLWHFYDIVYNGTDLLFYRDGSLIKSITTNIRKLIKIYKLFIGIDNAEEISRNPNSKYSFFKIYSTALSAEDIKYNYDTAVALYKDGTIENSYFIEESNSASEIASEYRTTKAHLFDEVPGQWVKILHHDNKSGTNLFAKTDDFAGGLVYKNDDCWCDFTLLNTANHGDKYEFYVRQYPAADNKTYQEFRFVQNENPLTTTFANTVHSKILDYYGGIESKFGGFLKHGTNTYLCANNNSNGNWWGAAGSWSTYGGGLPGYNGANIKGLYEIYLRVYNDENEICEVYNSRINATSLNET